MIFLKCTREELEILVKAGWDPRHIFADAEIVHSVSTEIEKDREADAELTKKDVAESNESPF